MSQRVDWVIVGTWIILALSCWAVLGAAIWLIVWLV